MGLGGWPIASLGQRKAGTGKEERCVGTGVGAGVGTSAECGSSCLPSHHHQSWPHYEELNFPDFWR